MDSTAVMSSNPFWSTNKMAGEGFAPIAFDPASDSPRQLHLEDREE